MKYEATYSFNCRRYIKREIVADTPGEAERIAKAEAWADIDAEVVRLQNCDGFSDAAEIDAYLFLDPAEGIPGDPIVECELEEPKP